MKIQENINYISKTLFNVLYLFHFFEKGGIHIDFSKDTIPKKAELTLYPIVHLFTTLYPVHLFTTLYPSVHLFDIVSWYTSFLSLYPVHLFLTLLQDTMSAPNDDYDPMSQFEGMTLEELVKAPKKQKKKKEVAQATMTPEIAKLLREFGATETDIAGPSEPVNKKVSKPKPKSEEPVGKVGRTVKVKKARGRPLKLTGDKALVLKAAGATDEDIERKQIVEVKEEKPKVGRGKYMKLSKIKKELEQLEGEELVGKIAEMASISDEAERKRAERYQERLEQRKAARAAAGKQRGRPRKAPEEKAPRKKKEVEKPKPRKLASEMPEKDLKTILKNYENWKRRVMEISKADFLDTQHDTERSLISLLEQFVTSNAGLTGTELRKLYADDKKEHPDIIPYKYWLDTMMFALYLKGGITGQRLTTGTKSSRGTKALRDIRPEFKDVVNAEYPLDSATNIKMFWTVHNYNLIKK